MLDRGAEALSAWCEPRALTWTSVPVSWYWPGVTMSVVVRDGQRQSRAVDTVPSLISRVSVMRQELPEDAR